MINFNLIMIVLSIVWWVLWLGLSRSAQADFMVHSWENEFPQSSTSVHLSSDYFYTTSNFGKNGTATVPTGMTSYAKLSGDLKLGVKLIDHLGAYGRLNWSYVNLISTVQGGSTFGLGDQSIGLTYRLTEFNAGKTLSMDLQSQLDFPAYKDQIPTNGSSVYLGDGSVDWTAGLFVNYLITEGRRFRLQSIIGLGYTYRSNGYSAQLPGSLSFRLIPQLHGFTSELDFVGFASLQTDRTLQNLSTGNRLGSTSFINGAINPSLLQVALKGGYRFNLESQLNFKGKLNLAGQNAPTGYTLSVEFEFLLGKSSPRRIEKQILSSAPTLPDPDERAQPSFTTYSIYANIIKTNNRLNLVKINKGSQDGIEAGQTFDIFNTKMNGQDGEVIARAQATHVRVNETALEIIEFYKEVPIEEGMITRRVIQ